MSGRLPSWIVIFSWIALSAFAALNFGLWYPVMGHLSWTTKIHLGAISLAMLGGCALLLWMVGFLAASELLERRRKARTGAGKVDAVLEWVRGPEGSKLLHIIGFVLAAALFSR